jgi:hypothetical protein
VTCALRGAAAQIKKEKKRKKKKKKKKNQRRIGGKLRTHSNDCACQTLRTSIHTTEDGARWEISQRNPQRNQPQHQANHCLNNAQKKNEKRKKRMNHNKVYKVKSNSHNTQYDFIKAKKFTSFLISKISCLRNSKF